MPESGTMRDPGLRSLVSPTHDWKSDAPAAFHWVRYVPLGDGWVRRDAGFAATREEALELAHA